MIENCLIEVVGLFKHNCVHDDSDYRIVSELCYLQVIQSSCFVDSLRELTILHCTRTSTFALNVSVFPETDGGLVDLDMLTWSCRAIDMLTPRLPAEIGSHQKGQAYCIDHMSSSCRLSIKQIDMSSSGRLSQSILLTVAH